MGPRFQRAYRSVQLPPILLPVILLILFQLLLLLLDFILNLEVGFSDNVVTLVVIMPYSPQRRLLLLLLLLPLLLVLIPLLKSHLHYCWFLPCYEWSLFKWRSSVSFARTPNPLACETLRWLLVDIFDTICNWECYSGTQVDFDITFERSNFSVYLIRAESQVDL